MTVSVIRCLILRHRKQLDLHGKILLSEPIGKHFGERGIAEAFNILRAKLRDTVYLIVHFQAFLFLMSVGVLKDDRKLSFIVTVHTVEVRFDIYRQDGVGSTLDLKA